MKKKGLFLLGSMLMAGALAGGTFALWAVTDNADPLNFKVSTGSIISDDTQFLTLEWGESTSIGNVSGLEQNKYRKAGVLDLHYTTPETDPDTVNGVLSLNVSALGKLAEKLHVEAYRGINIEADANNVISQANYDAAQSKKLTFTSNEAVIDDAQPHTIVTIVAYLDASTDAADMAAMASLQATVTVDWDLVEEDKVTAYTIYASGFKSGVAPYVYAWSATDLIGEWPGLQMTPVTGKDGLYTAQVKTTYTQMIISGTVVRQGEYEPYDVNTQTADLALTGASSVLKNGANWFVAGAIEGEGEGAKLTGTWSVLPEETYFLVGKQFEDWKTPSAQTTRVALHLEEGVYKATVALSGDSVSGEDAGFKVIQPFNGTWYDNGEGNVTVAKAGTYEITFNPAAVGAKITAVLQA